MMEFRHGFTVLRKKNYMKLRVALDWVKDWLKDNHIMLHQGCIMTTFCVQLESVNRKTPWVLEVIEDLSKKN